MRILERPLPMLRLVTECTRALSVLNHKLKLVHVLLGLAFAFVAGVAEYLGDWAAALYDVAGIRSQGVLRLGGLVGLQVCYQRVEWVLLVETFDLVRVAETLLSLQLVEVLAWLDGESALLVLVCPGDDIALPPVLRP